jgi:hypothetical protein
MEDMFKMVELKLILGLCLFLLVILLEYGDDLKAF